MHATCCERSMQQEMESFMKASTNQTLCQIEVPLPTPLRRTGNELYLLAV
jgi:hypothetical protein